MRTACTAMGETLDEDGAPAVHRDDLPGHVRRAGEEVYCLRNIFRRADARERRSLDDAATLCRVELAILGPGNGARRHAIYAHVGSELECEGARHRGKTCL